ncbi:M48 family metallopeptidase [Leptolyngbya sp. FACHB-261]|uniref:M48 family metallopeptidase n=1 Tax=Leptolyngbya sp. FACHB-261 TaxID=2692806 RepID=UPI001685B140|nr:M48 family metallopeptidase [Leptolyngbya sp. FACHB-261]MBD2105055.1 M48 family metallopeptidase [Leptolyngbya sp. FACHB-261]
MSNPLHSSLTGPSAFTSSQPTPSKSLLTGLRADHFRHPLDLQATELLRQFPGLDLLVRNLLGPLGEKFFYLDNIASSVLVGENQLPHLYRLLQEACAILDLEPPQLYVRQNPTPNAYTFAMRGRQPFIVLHTSLIDLLTEQEIQAVIAHELGHLKCEHSVYLTPANLLILAAGQLPGLGAAVAQTLQAQLLAWVRCAEFTCDRAALLVTQDPAPMVSVLMKLAGGSPSLSAQLNYKAFLDQARAYDEIDMDELGQMLKELRTSQLTHPVPVLRAREIDRWAQGDQYRTLLKNRYNKERSGKSPEGSGSSTGGWRNW